MKTTKTVYQISKGKLAPGFFQSIYDGTYWLRYADDRPNKFYGQKDNLPAKAKKLFRP